MSDADPWEVGDHDARWRGYFVPGTTVLRNLLGLTARIQLQEAEDDLSEARLVELRENPAVLGERTYGLQYLAEIHRYLFQDVYAWAGRARTVGISKGGESFCPPASITQPMMHVADEIERSDRLRPVPSELLPGRLAYLYDYVNWAHPFREGNGRSTREFFALLLAERGQGLDWSRIDTQTMHSACHSARADSDISGLAAMFTQIIDHEPAYDFDTDIMR